MAIQLNSPLLEIDKIPNFDQQPGTFFTTKSLILQKPNMILDSDKTTQRDSTGIIFTYNESITMRKITQIYIH